MKTTRTLFSMLLVVMIFVSAGNLQAQRNYIQLTNGINCGPSSGITSSHVTVEFWAYLESTNAKNGTFFANLDNGNGFFCNISASNWGQFQCGGSTLWFNCATFLDKWTHFSCVADGSNLIIYANGTEFAKTACTTGYVATAGTLLLSAASWGDFLLSKIADFRVWNKACSANEIATNMNTIMPVGTLDLLINYTFTEKTGTFTHNTMSTSTDNNGVIVGSATWGTYTVTGITDNIINNIIVSKSENAWLLSGMSKNSKIKLIGINGSLIKQLNASENTVVIPSTNLSKGVYILQVLSNGTNQQFSVIK